MRVLYLTHQYFPRHVGGTEVYLRGLVRRTVAAGHEARVVTCAEEPSGDPARARVERTEHEGVPVVEARFNLSIQRRPARAEYDNGWAGERVAEEVRAWKPDVVHALHAMKLSGAALVACHRAGVPVVATLTDFWFLCARHTLVTWDGRACEGPGHLVRCAPCLSRLHKVAAPPRDLGSVLPYVRDLGAIAERAGFLRRALLGCRRIVALSQSQVDAFVANGYPRRRFEVIEHGVEAEDLDPGPTAPEPVGTPRPLRVGFIGSVVPHKGLDVWLRALALARDVDVRCPVHGELQDSDPYAAEVRALAAADPRVRFEGTFEPSEIGRVLRGMDALVVPSQWRENAPLVVKAALHLGMPVLASRVASVTEMLDGDRAAWLVPPGDPAAWAQALRRLAASPPPRFAPRKIKTMDENAREMLAVYEATLDGASA